MRNRGARRPNRAMGAAVQQSAATQRAAGLRAQIRHWLLALEQYHNLRNRPKSSRRAFTVTYCNGGGGDHWWHVRLTPRPPARSTQVDCTVPRDKYPDDVREAHIMQPLREEGFAVSAVRYHPCGCATFTVQPRTLAGQ